MISLGESVKKSPVQPNINTAYVFFKYIKEHKKEAFTFIIFHVVFAIVLRYCYPYADITSDTGGYVNAVNHGFRHGGIRPLGYSYFLIAIKTFGHQTLFIFLLQYIIYCIAAFFFYSSTTFLFGISNKYTRYTYLLVTILFIPGLYATNVVMTDSLFTSLTVMMITFCLWLLHTQNKYLIIPIIILLLAAISIRYIGVIYPAFIIPVIILTYKKNIRSAWLSLIVVIAIYGYVHTVKKGTLEDRGVEVFSAFAGWQKANNALHVIPHIDIAKSAITTSRTDLLRIDTIVRITYAYNKHLYPDSRSVSYDFMWLDSMPLTLALNYHLNVAHDVGFYNTWNACGVMFSEYGDLLIREHWPEYFRYYIVNNAKRTFYPPEELFESFADTTFSPVITTWFKWDANEHIRPRHDFLRPLLRNMSGIYSIYWVLFILSNVYLVMQLWRKKISFSSTQFSLFFLLLFFTWVYTLASIYASPVNLRFLLPVKVTISGLVFALIQHALPGRGGTKSLKRA